ncbi:hypothetical protein HYC85_009383 [Camellia sinensis]|uniref:mitogen-activated protein kinase n=1 Tax=Camellia sinensis TaxID=4442 RepID=A0A7J7HFG7_CAMSI|nr:hypothetical protein HYC85_009383 [Camellia sinensis]
MQRDQRKKSPKEMDFFTEYGDANRYKILKIIGKGTYGVVCAAIDTHTGEKVSIKKINDIFENTSDAIRVLREVKLLRLLRHPDIVDIKSIMLPPSRREFKDIYVVFELMESDLHQVIEANDDLTHDHHRFFLYQMLPNVYHRDLKPKNILANANCKLKICDFGLARVAFKDTPTAIFWTDYVATRWYRAPELCGSFFSKYTPAIDIWSVGCVFAEVLTGKPLFPGKNIVHQLDLITDLLGTPSSDTISVVQNEKARRYLTSMRKKQPVPFSEKIPNADPLALRLLQRLLAFDAKDRPTAEEALADPYFKGLAKAEREPSCQPISKLEFEFERRRVTEEEIRKLIFREILEYHPQLLKYYLAGNEGANFLYPSAVGQFRKQFAYLEENSGKSGPVIPPERKHVSLPRAVGQCRKQFAYLEENSGKSGPVIPPERKHVSLPRSTVYLSRVPPKTNQNLASCDGNGVGEIRGNQASTEWCMVVSTSNKMDQEVQAHEEDEEQVGIEPIAKSAEELEKVPIDLADDEKFFLVGNGLSLEENDQAIHFLIQFSDVLSSTAAQLTHSNAASHRTDADTVIFATDLKRQSVAMQKPQYEATLGISDLLGKDESIIATGQRGGLSVDLDRLNNERKLVGLRLGMGLLMALFSRKEFVTKMTDKLPHSLGKESLEIILQAGKELEDAPFLFFHDMSALHVLDLSYTSVNSLPQSISRLNALQKLILRGCDFLMELPPEIGELTNLEVIDLEGTEIIYLPKEIAKLMKLSCLKVSFYRYANKYQESKHIDTIIPSASLSNLSRLNELSIDVNPDGDWWDVEVKTIIHDLCSLRELRTLKLYLPTIELLEVLIRDSPSLICPALTHFRFIVGRQVERFLSRLPNEVEEEFNNMEKSEKGLKYVNGEGIPIEIIEVLKHANAFSLEHHWTVNNLSEFGLQNMDKLKFCFLVECNELRTIIDAKQFYQGDCEGYDSYESEQYSYFNEEMVLGSLKYLSIHYMKNMESICQGSVGKGCLSNLKFLALHTCLSLSSIFTVGMLQNLVNLEELIVEDCTKISSLVDLKNSDPKSGHFLLNLKKILLLELPKLVSISNGLCIAPKLERMVIFYCPKLVKLSTMEVSSKDLKVIKGENEWWGALKWHESDLSSDHQDYLASVFCIFLLIDGENVTFLVTVCHLCGSHRCWRLFEDPLLNFVDGFTFEYCVSLWHALVASIFICLSGSPKDNNTLCIVYWQLETEPIYTL